MSLSEFQVPQNYPTSFPSSHWPTEHVTRSSSARVFERSTPAASLSMPSSCWTPCIAAKGHKLRDDWLGKDGRDKVCQPGLVEFGRAAGIQKSMVWLSKGRPAPTFCKRSALPSTKRYARKRVQQRRQGKTTLPAGGEPRRPSFARSTPGMPTSKFRR